MAKREDLIIENAELKFLNFEGREDRNPKTGKIMNSEGKRNFHVVVPEELVDTLTKDGWNVKELAHEEGEPAVHTVKVNVSYRYREPVILKYEGRREIRLSEESVATLDYEDVISADLIIHPSEYLKDDGSTGLSGYLTELRIKVKGSPFAEKYADYMGPEE